MGGREGGGERVSQGQSQPQNTRLLIWWSALLHFPLSTSSLLPFCEWILFPCRPLQVWQVGGLCALELCGSAARNGRGAEAGVRGDVWWRGHVRGVLATQEATLSRFAAADPVRRAQTGSSTATDPFAGPAGCAGEPPGGPLLRNTDLPSARAASRNLMDCPWSVIIDRSGEVRGSKGSKGLKR